MYQSRVQGMAENTGLEMASGGAAALRGQRRSGFKSLPCSTRKVILPVNRHKGTTPS